MIPDLVRIEIRKPTVIGYCAVIRGVEMLCGPEREWLHLLWSGGTLRAHARGYVIDGGQAWATQLAMNSRQSLKCSQVQGRGCWNCRT
jgi:hypothetical protein